MLGVRPRKAPQDTFWRAEEFEYFLKATLARQRERDQKPRWD